MLNCVEHKSVAKEYDVEDLIDKRLALVERHLGQALAGEDTYVSFDIAARMLAQAIRDIEAAA